MISEYGTLSDSETSRLGALHACGILDTLRDEEYDGLTRLAAYLCKAPIAYISFIAEERIWLKSKFGVDPALENIPRSESLCQYTLDEAVDIVQVHDALNDDRFKDKPSVTGPPYIRSYTGVPLIDDEGFRLGSFCVADVVPRTLGPQQLDAVKLLAKQALSLVMLRKQRRLHQEFADLFDCSTELHAVLDEQRNVVQINRSVETMLGYTPAEVRGKSLMEFAPPADISAIRADVNRRISNGISTLDVEMRLVHKNGSEKWISWNASRKENCWYASGRDVTEQKETNRKLQELSVVASNVSNGVVMADTQQRVLWVNSAFEKITGYALAEVYGQRVGDVLRGKDTDFSVVEKARAFAERQQTYQESVLVYRKDGTPIWISASNSHVLDTQGNIDRHIEIISDITAKKRADDIILKAKEEAVQLNRAKDLFISVMSHEIRTPLNAVIGVSHLLMDDELTEQQRENVQILQFSAGNLMGLINDVLDLTKIETGHLELEQARVDLRELIHGIIATQQYRVQEKNIYLRAEIDPSIPKYIKGDQTRLYQIAMNLIGNAIKFTARGGITVRLKNTGENGRSVDVLFEFIDTGIGVPADKREEIFEVFRQASSDTTRHYGGTGLGLPITRKLVQLHHSDIRLKSEPGQGSNFAFTIRFPIAENVSREPVETIMKALNMRVLVVDDNQINRMLVGKMLNKWGVQADYAEDGLQALAKVENNPHYKLVLMDINMPNMGGLEATQHIRRKQQEYFRDLPIVALTASVMQNEIDAMGEAGMNDYVLKPFEPDALYRKLEKYA
ncbi:MAG: PAS domain S-box protein [Mucilaginibacter polytrichastri]|nr:PAS domain S-box protein [Mucilaginibacter polytrichastri]